MRLSAKKQPHNIFFSG